MDTNSSSSNVFATDLQNVADQEWDYVIVGAGPGGCVLAHRLSEDADNKVLLIEAGQNHEDEMFSRIPIAFPRLFKTEADWDFSTTAQPNLAGRELYWPRGKMLGGSTSINAMMFQHATPQDLNEWESLGATGWGAKAMQPYFRKCERFTPHASHAETTHEHRGDSGYWATGFSHLHPNSAAFIEACQTVGIPRSQDISTPKGAIGVCQMVTFIDEKGQRSSAATSYLPAQILARENLTVVISTRATKLIFSPSTTSVPRCTGVQVSQSATGPQFAIKARKEVLLCAGSIATPQILSVSGIAPKDVLERLNKEGTVEEIVVNEHVGRNLVDHLAVSILLRAKESMDYLGDPDKSLPALAQWMANGTGPMTGQVGEVAAFVRLDDTLHLSSTPASKLPEVADTTSGAGSPDIEIIGAPLAFLRHGLTPAPDGQAGFTIAPVHLRPLSRGSIEAVSANVWNPPRIEPNYLSNKVDIDAFIRATRISLKISRAEPLAKELILKQRATGEVSDKSDPFWLADSDPDALTDEEIESWLREKVETLYHPVGTARIAQNPQDGVVDPELKVFGVEGLRIVDASVFPAQISGHTSATCFAIGEKAAEMVLASWPKA